MKPHTCPVCQGMRQVRNPNPYGYTAAPLVIPCPTCGGIGVLWEPEDLREALPRDLLAPKTLDANNTADAAGKVSDVQVFGNPDLWQLVCKASSKSQGWMKSTKALALPGYGVVLQVSTQQGDHVAEALCFVPGPCDLTGPYDADSADHGPSLGILQWLGLGRPVLPPKETTGDPREEVEKMKAETEEGEILADGEDPHLGALDGDVFGLKK